MKNPKESQVEQLYHFFFIIEFTLKQLIQSLIVRVPIDISILLSDEYSDLNSYDWIEFGRVDFAAGNSVAFGVIHSNNGSSSLIGTIVDRLAADCMPR